MNGAPRTIPIALPLLDRLIDEPLPLDLDADPEDRSPGRAAVDPLDRLRPEFVRRDVARLRLEAILRDLEVLLNTRRSLVSLPEPPGELVRSVLDFGLSAPRGAGPTSASRRENLRREVETAIHRFEPRLSDVRVALDAESGPLERLRLRIEGSLAGSEPVALRAHLDPSTGRFGVKGDLT
jgi:type VI secretion system protein ImpF